MCVCACVRVCVCVRVRVSVAEIYMYNDSARLFLLQTLASAKFPLHVHDTYMMRCTSGVGTI